MTMLVEVPFMNISKMLLQNRRTPTDGDQERLLSGHSGPSSIDQLSQSVDDDAHDTKMNV